MGFTNLYLTQIPAGCFYGGIFASYAGIDPSAVDTAVTELSEAKGEILDDIDRFSLDVDLVQNSADEINERLAGLPVGMFYDRNGAALPDPSSVEDLATQAASQGIAADQVVSFVMGDIPVGSFQNDSGNPVAYFYSVVPPIVANGVMASKDAIDPALQLMIEAGNSVAQGMGFSSFTMQDVLDGRTSVVVDDQDTLHYFGLSADAERYMSAVFTGLQQQVVLAGPPCSFYQIAKGTCTPDGTGKSYSEIKEYLKARAPYLQEWAGKAFGGGVALLRKIDALADTNDLMFLLSYILFKRFKIVAKSPKALARIFGKVGKKAAVVGMVGTGSIAAFKQLTTGKGGLTGLAMEQLYKLTWMLTREVARRLWPRIWPFLLGIGLLVLPFILYRLFSKPASARELKAVKK